MKQINNIKSEVYLSRYDNSDTLIPVSEEYKNLQNICVAVKFGDIVIKISPANTCKCSWYEAMENHADKLMNPAYWNMVGNVCREVNQAIEMLGHDPIDWVWTSMQCSVYSAWSYYGAGGLMLADTKDSSLSVRATRVFKIER